MVSKNEFIQKVALATGETQKNTGKILDEILSSIQTLVADGEKVAFIGFGSFEARERKERTVVSPVDGKEILIPATKVPAFKPGKVFKTAVAEKVKAKTKKKK